MFGSPKDSAGASSSAAAPGAGAALDPTRWNGIISRAISSHGGLRAGNAVTYLIDGPATFKEMVNAFATATGAEHYIYLLGWQLVDDFDMDPPAATKFKDLMAAASGRGVQIRAMLWDQYGSTNTAEVATINRLAHGGAILDNATHSTVTGAHHQKILVVKGSDGLIGFCGDVDINSDRIAAPAAHGGGSSGLSDHGTAVASSGSSGTAGAPLHDVHCKIIGPSASDVLTTFIRRWDHHPDSRAINTAKGDLLGRHEPVPAATSTPSTTGRACSVAIGRTFTPATSGSTAPRERDIQTLLLAAIGSAERFIYMEDQYLISPEAAAALNRAVPRLSHLTATARFSPYNPTGGTDRSTLLCHTSTAHDVIDPPNP